MSNNQQATALIRHQSLVVRDEVGTPERDPALVYLAGLAPTGRRLMAGRLALVARLLGYMNPREVAWSALRFEHVAALRTKLQELGHAPATVNAALYALRGVARAAWNLGVMSADDYHRIRNVGTVRGTRLPSGRALNLVEIATLLKACEQDKTAAGARDAALVALLFGAGLRRSEVVALDVESFEFETGALKVSGKGNKERLVYLAVGGEEAISDWLVWRGTDPGALVTPIRKGGRIEIRRMTDQAVYSALRRRAKAAGVRTFSPHDLRRTFVSELLDAGADLAAVQQLAGHASVVTTVRYDRRGEAGKRKAAGMIRLPYRAYQVK